MIEISPIKFLDATVEVPGSKSLTQRALIAAALAEGTSTLLGPLASEDTHYTITALRLMGIKIDNSDPTTWVVQGTGGV
ncbi:MAG: 3-phosphoshikimate 1-carboxyvinyltransferase, partial [Candidatus Electrothrix sp. AR3]|nr:3-phosphoshikimate 1-carboxyvinyltransferase [Candidatus Electrothrix sp. AR3]